MSRKQFHEHKSCSSMRIVNMIIVVTSQIIRYGFNVAVVDFVFRH